MAGDEDHGDDEQDDGDFHGVLQDGDQSFSTTRRLPTTSRTRWGRWTAGRRAPGHRPLGAAVAHCGRPVGLPGVDLHGLADVHVDVGLALAAGPAAAGRAQVPGHDRAAADDGGGHQLDCQAGTRVRRQGARGQADGQHQQVEGSRHQFDRHGRAGQQPPHRRIRHPGLLCSSPALWAIRPRAALIAYTSRLASPHPAWTAPMKFRFPIVIIDEDYRSENTSGLGIRALAQAIETEGFEVLGVTSYGDLSQFAQQQSRASAFILSIDDEEFTPGPDLDPAVLNLRTSSSWCAARTRRADLPVRRDQDLAAPAQRHPARAARLHPHVRGHAGVHGAPHHPRGQVVPGRASSRRSSRRCSTTPRTAPIPGTARGTRAAWPS
jgi:hypothetical protein